MKLIFAILFAFTVTLTTSAQPIVVGDSTVWTFIVKPEPEYSTNRYGEKSVKVIKSDYKSFVSSIYLFSSYTPKSPFQLRTYLIKGKVFIQKMMVLGDWGPTWVTRMYLQPISVRRYFEPEGN